MRFDKSFGRAALLVVTMAGVCVWGSARAQSATSGLGAGAEVGGKSEPVIYTSFGRDLLETRNKYKAGDERIVKIAKKMIEDADKALGLTPPSVVNKKHFPPSGDKHDYMSLSPYWWPDPSKPDGKPYIRRDGQFNPERAEYDLNPLETMSRGTRDLAMGYFLTGDEKYAAKCAELLRVWFINAETRMNPHLKYAQSVPGLNIIRPSGIIEGGRFRDVVDAVGLIQGSAAWTKDDDAAVRHWFKELFTYITTSEQGRAELDVANNHASWATVQTGTYALFVGDKDGAKKLLESQFKRLVDAQIKPDGSQPEELARTLSFHYSRFNLLALIEIASLGERVGLDLWKYKTPDGISLTTATDYLVPYAVQEKEWPHQQISPIKYGDMVMVLRRMANAYNRADYEAAAERIRQKDPRELVDFFYPSRLNTAQ